MHSLFCPARCSSTVTADCLVTMNYTAIAEEEEQSGNDKEEEEHDSSFTKGCSMVTIGEIPSHNTLYQSSLVPSPAPLHPAGYSTNLSSCLRTAVTHLTLPPLYSFLRVFIPKHSPALTFNGKYCVSSVLSATLFCSC